MSPGPTSNGSRFSRLPPGAESFFCRPGPPTPQAPETPPQTLLPRSLRTRVRQPPFAVPATLYAHCRRLHAHASEPAICAAPYVLVVLRCNADTACRGGNPFCACASGETQYTRMPRACVRGVGETLTSDRCGVLSQPLMPRCDAPLAAWRGPFASSL